MAMGEPEESPTAPVASAKEGPTPIAKEGPTPMAKEGPTPMAASTSVSQEVRTPCAVVNRQGSDDREVLFNAVKARQLREAETFMVRQTGDMECELCGYLYKEDEGDNRYAARRLEHEAECAHTAGNALGGSAGQLAVSRLRCAKGRIRLRGQRPHGRPEDDLDIWRASGLFPDLHVRISSGVDQRILATRVAVAELRETRTCAIFLRYPLVLGFPTW
eukprot:scaffold146_cov265-Pinguiococcus_pyrenoidosus.AAC.23